MADEFTPNQPNTNQKKQSRNVQNDAFGDVVDFANLHSFDGTAFDEQFQNLASFGENLQTGQQSLIDQTVQGAVNVKKAVGEADARSEGADRFTQKDETGAVKSTIDQFGKSFAANRESLREASDRYFETAGTLLQQDTVLEELGQNIWDNTSGSRKEKWEKINSSMDKALQSDQLDIFFDDGINTWQDANGDLTKLGEEKLDTFTTEEFDKADKWQKGNVWERTAIVGQKTLLEAPLHFVEGAIRGVYDMTIGIPIAMANGEWGKAALNAALLGVTIATWGAGAGVAAEAKTLEAAGSTVAKGVVKNKAEKTAFKRLGKAAAKEADNIIPPPAGMGEAFNSVIGTGAKDLWGEGGEVFLKDVNEGLNKSIKTSVTNVAEETSGFLKESADKTLTKNIKNGNFTDIDVNKLGKGNKKLSTRIADEVKSSDALTKHRNALSEIAKNPKNYGSDVSKYAGDLLKELDPDRIAKDVIESFNSNQKHVRNYFTESLKESKPTRAGRRNNKRIAKANKKGKELKDPNWLKQKRKKYSPLQQTKWDPAEGKWVDKGGILKKNRLEGEGALRPSLRFGARAGAINALSDMFVNPFIDAVDSATSDDNSELGFLNEYVDGTINGILGNNYGDNPFEDEDEQDNEILWNWNS